MSLKDRLFQYGPTPTAHDIVKALAILSMIVDHTGLFIFGDNAWFRILGRLAGPLFFFAIGNSLNTLVTWKLFSRGLFLSVLSSAFSGNISLNILLSFLLCKMLFQSWQPEKYSWKLLSTTFLLLVLSCNNGSMVIEYGSLGIVWAIAGRLVRQKSPHKNWWIISSSIFYYLWAGLHFNAFERSDQTILLTLICSLLITLLWFRKGSLTIPKILSYPIMLLSRFSLEIYFYHYTLFLLFALAFMK